MPSPRPILRVPAYVINGPGVALGTGLPQLFIGGIVGRAAALTASSAAVCTSLADVPLAPHQRPGGTPKRRLKARLKEASDS